MDSEINVSVGPEIQPFPFLEPLAELRNCVYEEFLLMSDFNPDMLVFHHCIPRKARPRTFFLLHHGNLPILAANLQMRFEATSIFLAKMFCIPNGFRCLQRLVRGVGIPRLQELRSAGVVESQIGGSTGGVLPPYINSLDPHRFDPDEF